MMNSNIGRGKEGGDIMTKRYVSSMWISDFYHRKIHTVLSRFLPFCFMDKVYRVLDKSSGSILDVGCGWGYPMQILSERRRFFSIGVDIFMPYLREAKRRKIHDDYVLCDVRFLPFKRKSFDTALCVEMMEHLPKNQGTLLISEREKTVRKQLIITTPNMFQRNEPHDDNPYQVHKSGWTKDEFQRMGFEVVGAGLRCLFMKRDHAYVKHPSVFTSLLIHALSYLCESLTYKFPSIALVLICFKRVQPAVHDSGEKSKKYFE